MGPQPLRDPQRRALVRLGQQDHEFLAAEPAGQVVIAHLLAQRGPQRTQHHVSGQVTIGVIDGLEVIDVYQGQRQRGAGPDRARDLRRRLGLPGARVEQPRLGVDARLGQELRVHHVPPGQQDGGDGENSQYRLDGDGHGNQDAEVDLNEVGLQRLAVQRHFSHAGRGIRELDRDGDQHPVQAAHDVADGDGGRPGERVQADADHASGEGRGQSPEHERRRAIGQADGRAGEHPAIDDALTHSPVGEQQQRDGRDHRIERREQDRDREHPDRQEILHHRAPAVCHPGGRHHRDHAAAEQQEELRQVADLPRRLRRRDSNARDRNRDDRADISPQPTVELPPLPVPDSGAGTQAACDGRGSHETPFRTRRDESVADQKLTVKN
jgi:hypothetical protein